MSKISENIAKSIWRYFFIAETIGRIADEAQPWNADEAYKIMGNNTYLLCYDYGLVTIEFSFEITDEQKKIAGEILASEPV